MSVRVSECKSEFKSDLKLRVIEYIELGGAQKCAGEIFKVSSSAVSSWWRAYKQYGSYALKRRGGSKGKVDKEALCRFVQVNGDKTLIEIGAHFGVKGSSIYEMLKKLGFRYKKSLHLHGGR